MSGVMVTKVVISKVVVVVEVIVMEVAVPELLLEVEVAERKSVTTAMVGIVEVIEVLALVIESEARLFSTRFGCHR